MKNIFEKQTSLKLFFISIIVAIFIVYPNIACFPWEMSFLVREEQTAHTLFFIFRYIFFAVFIFILLWYNLHKIKGFTFIKRLLRTFLLTAVAYGLYYCLSRLFHTKSDCFGSILLFQFAVVLLVCTLIGHLFMMYAEQIKKEQEIEKLKVESLQSRCDALANQINPHFFFNSLNGITALIRKKDDKVTLEYVTTLSDVFRYILQSDKKDLVSLDEELRFVDSFRYMMEVRFANKLIFNIKVDEKYLSLKMPVLSLLPLIDNVVAHNTIDSEHKMEVTISFNEKSELVVSNPIYPKLAPPDTNGTGLKNLENRFALMMNKTIRTENDGNTFKVFLPLE